MFTANSLQYLLLALTIGLVFAQLLVQQKRAMHILFAIFCGSVAMATAQKLSGNALGAYQYLVGLGACATCNVYWLFSRTLFRNKNVFSYKHVGFALALGGILMSKQLMLFMVAYWQLDGLVDQFALGLLRELTVMLSSAVLLLAIWEGARGFYQGSKTEQRQRTVYLATLCSAIFITKAVAGSEFLSSEQVQMVMALVSVCVIAITQGLMVWIERTRTVTAQQLEEVQPSPAIDEQLGQQISAYLNEQQHYLQANLKVADVARALDVSEYLVSRTIKQMSDKNFNQFVNQLRIEHAQRLLQDPSKQHWSILVVGLESGFASVGPFNRAFKQQTGETPNQFRQHQLGLLASV